MSSPPLSSKARAIGESTTLAISARASALRDAGHPVISLSAGEPDLGTPEAIGNGGIEAIQSGHTRYTPSSGLPELRLAGAEWLAGAFGIAVDPTEIMVTAGAKPALHLAFTALLDPGDRVLVAAPYWVSYPDLIRVSGGEPVIVPPVPEQGHIHTPEQFAQAARASGAKGIVLNYPNNPSGAVPSREWVEAVVAEAAAAGMWILSDEIYGLILYDDAEHVSPATVPGGAERTIVVTGGTKSHSMTGWRIGFLAGPQPVVAAAGRIQSQAMGNPCTISQHAALALVTGDFDDELRRRTAAYDERRKYLVQAVTDTLGLDIVPPKGAFYALLDVRSLCAERDVEDSVLCNQILEQVHVALVPGSAFGIPGFVRASYAVSMEQLTEAVARLSTFVQSRP